MKRIVTIQDISCVGKCSLTVALPIISAMGIEASIIPTAVLSAHTIFEGHTFKDLTDEIAPISEHWKKEGFDFDAIYTGYLGSKKQIDIVSKFFDDFKTDGNFIFIDLVGSLKGIGKNEYTFFRSELTVDYGLKLPPVGKTDIKFTLGKIIGTVPYPMLKLHEGNGTYIMDPSSFSCMGFYEFASDTWGTLFLEHNFNGFFFGKIPLIKKLHWREILTVKAAYGTLSRKNNGIVWNSNSKNAPLLFPEGMNSLNKPYVEMGVGVSNILRLIRVDAFWRMTHRSISKMAEGVAKQIYHIRESRINWLTGEVDHMPADGKSLEMILKQLDRQEKQLTSLFLGKETRKTLHKTICIDPKEMTDEVVFRFSEIQGIVDADDLSGEPFYMTAVVTKSTYNTEKTKKKTAESPIFYNLPGSIYLTLTDGTPMSESTSSPRT